MPNFYWGASTSAYQIEGAYLDEGKGLSIWDVFCRKKGNIQDNSNGDVGCNHYYKYEEDVEIMRQLNLNAYRFSISWPRILPTGRKHVNQKGLDFYDRLIDCLLSKGIEPVVTLYHFDLPYELSLRGGWYSRETAEYFADYTDIVIRRFSDRVKNWITINEPLTISALGYFTGNHAPGYRSILKGSRVVHNLMLAHGLSMDRIRGAGNDLKAGISNILYPPYPLREKDMKAVEKVHDINRIFMDPIFKGKYPDSSRMFTPTEKIIKDGDMKIISQPIDFIGLNVYSRTIVKNSILPIGFKAVSPAHGKARFTDMGWEIYPKAIYEVLKWVDVNYGKPEILVTENGAAFDDKVEDGRVADYERLEFLKENIYYVEKAIRDGINIKGYFAWSLLDNFEWAFGLSKRFGLVYVDYKTHERIIKDSGYWYSRVCKLGGLGLKINDEDRRINKLRNHEESYIPLQSVQPVQANK